MLSQATAQRIEHWKLAELAPSPRNPRRHSDAQIAQIAGSIAQFGFNSPILIDSRGSIIAGHGSGIALQLPIDGCDAIQHASGQFNGRDFPRLNAAGDVAQIAVVEWFRRGLLSRWAAR
jgi:ParB-like nuclease domain